MGNSTRKTAVIESYMPPGLQRMADGWTEAADQVFRMLTTGAEDFDRLTVRRRGDGDWVFVMKAFDDAGTPIVAFGTGYDFFSGLLGLEGALRRNGWRVDKPYDPSKDKG
jgi:hypothetical protein